MLAEFGMWWRGEFEGERVLIDRNDFSKKDAEEVYDKLKRRAVFCRRQGVYDVVKTQIGREEYYILINSQGDIELPHLKNGRTGKTTNLVEIPTYSLSYSARQNLEEKV